ncbi:MAG: hypothetical protein ACT4NV_11795 [Rhodoferax sp.]
MGGWASEAGDGDVAGTASFVPRAKAAVRGISQVGCRSKNCRRGRFAIGFLSCWRQIPLLFRVIRRRACVARSLHIRSQGDGLSILITGGKYEVGSEIMRDGTVLDGSHIGKCI